MLIEHHTTAAKRTALATAAFAVLLLALAVFPTRSALALPQLVHAEPPNDAVLDEAPSSVELWFDQPLVSDFSATEVTLARAGTDAEIRPLYAAVDPRDLTRLIVTPPQSLREGEYLLKWRITAAQDDSVNEGEYVFSISSSAPASAETEEGGPDILFMALITLAGIGGGTALALLFYLGRRALGLGGHPTTETTLPEHH
jgi:copper transport protein